MLLGRKAMTNQNSILKSRDTTLPTKVHIVKGMVFPVVMYRCESWTLQKAEHRRIDAFKLCWMKNHLESPLDCKEINPVNPKGNQPWTFTGRTDAEAPIFGHLMQRTDSLEKTLMLGKIEGRRSGQQRIRWLEGITDAMDMSLSKLWEILKDREVWHAAVHGIAKIQTWLRDWTELIVLNSWWKG